MERAMRRVRARRVLAVVVPSLLLALGLAPSSPSWADTVPSAHLQVAAAPKKVTVLIKRGDSGKLVRRVQVALKRRGYHLAVNGKFGPQTHSAIRRFQRRAHLPVTGKVDRRTWRALGLGKPPTSLVTTPTTTVSPYQHPYPEVERWHSVEIGRAHV